MNLKLSLKDIKKNIAGMTPAEAADYIWTYYKWQILAAVFAVFLVISLFSAVTTNFLSHPVIRVGVVEKANIPLSGTIDKVLNEAFPAATGYGAPEHDSFTSPADEKNPYGPVQLIAYLSAGSLDVLLCDQATADYISSSGNEIRVVDISGTVLGKAAAENGVTPFLYVFLPTVRGDGTVDNSAPAAAEHLLDVIQKQ